MTDPGRIVRFLLTGLLNTAFGYAIYAALVIAGMGYLAALAAATAIGIVFNFFSFGRLAFRAAPRAHGFLRFLAAYAAAFLCNAALLWTAKERLGWDPVAAQLACIPPTVLVTYLMLNRWVYDTARPRGY